MKVLTTKLPGLLVIEPDVFADKRGFFMESWNDKRYKRAGVPGLFVQDNLSLSSKGTVRGLHYQLPHAQGKLVSVLKGEVMDVAVDLRRGSPTFLQWEKVVLSEKNKKQFYLPPGFAHGFEVLSKTALFFYKCTDFYNPECDRAIAWNDPDIRIAWHTASPALSMKDENAPRLAQIPEASLPVYETSI